MSVVDKVVGFLEGVFSPLFSASLIMIALARVSEGDVLGTVYYTISGVLFVADLVKTFKTVKGDK